MFPDKLNPIKYIRLECSCDRNNRIILRVYINGITAVSEGGLGVPVAPGGPPLVTVTHISEGFIALQARRGAFLYPFGANHALAVISSFVKAKLTDFRHITR